MMVFHPSSPSLFGQEYLSLSAALAAQTSVTAFMSEYMSTKRCESVLARAWFTLTNKL